MPFQVGDHVIHWAYGPGEIIQLDEKKLSGRVAMYYVVRAKDLTIWVPIEADKHSLRSPTSKSEFKKLFEILQSPGEELSEDRMERKNQLAERMRDGRLDTICRVIRDLHLFSHHKKLNENDNLILERARRFLLEEWTLSLSVPMNDAQRELDRLLDEGWNAGNGPKT